MSDQEWTGAVAEVHCDACELCEHDGAGRCDERTNAEVEESCWGRASRSYHTAEERGLLVYHAAEERGLHN